LHRLTRNLRAGEKNSFYPLDSKTVRVSPNGLHDISVTCHTYNTMTRRTDKRAKGQGFIPTETFSFPNDVRLFPLPSNLIMLSVH